MPKCSWYMILSQPIILRGSDTLVNRNQNRVLCNDDEFLGQSMTNVAIFRWNLQVTKKMLLMYLFSFGSFVFGNIVRLPCKSLARFDVVLDGFAATGIKAVATHHRVSRRQCVLHCISDTRCKCVNYNTLSSVCEVFSVRFFDVAQSLVVRSGWSFLAATDEVFVYIFVSGMS